LHSDVADKRVLAVSSKRGREQFGRDSVLGPLETCFVWIDSVEPNPTLGAIEAAWQQVKDSKFDCLVAFGGGSAMDFAKALAALSSSSEGADLRGLVADPQVLHQAPRVPIYAIPTTSGTGSEVTPFATIWDDENLKKLSLTSHSLFPAVAIVDPELSDNTPAIPTFSSGLDALNQAFESVWNRNRSPVTEVLAARAISLALDGLPSLLENLGDRDARDKLAEASLLAGLCISQTRTAICHAISYPLTAHFGVPHGFACAFTMAEILSLCVSRAPSLFETVVGVNGNSSPADLLVEVQSLLSALQVSSTIRRLAGNVEAILDVRGEMFTRGRSDNFPLDIDEGMLVLILTRSYGHTLS